MLTDTFQLGETGDGTGTWDVFPVNNERATLSSALRQVAGEAGDGPVTIRADARATHQSVVTAMDVAARQGFTQVNIATVSEQPEG